MKKIVALILAILFCFMAVACAKEGADTAATSKDATSATTTGAPKEDTPPAPLLAGFAERDFTPTEMGGDIPGGSGRVTATGVGLHLFANAAAFESNGNSLIMVSMDILMFLDTSANEARQRISEATGVPEKNILIAATHTHYGVGLNYRFYQAEPDEEAFNHAFDMAVEAAVEAWESRELCKMGTGTTTLEGYSFCREAFMTNGDVNTWPSKSRIDKLISDVDRSVNVMRFDDNGGNTKCFIVNYANHPDSSEYGVYSSDYPGYMRDFLKKEYGEDVIILYFNGPQGDVNYVDYLGGGSGGRNNFTIGLALANKVIELNKTIKADEEYPVIATSSRLYSVAQRHPSEEDLAWGEAIMEKVANGESVNELDKSFALEYTTADYSKLGNTYQIEIQAIVFGNFAMVGLPCEPFSEIGLKIKKGSPYKNTFVIALANGQHGYIAPDFIQGTSSYPARFSMYNAPSGKGTANTLITKSIIMLKQLKSDVGR